MRNKKSLTKTLIDAAKDLNLDKATIHELDSLNLPEVTDFSAKEIRALRDDIKASQGVFVALLNVNPSTVQKWERGEVKPQKAALKLLNVLATHGIEALLE